MTIRWFRAQLAVMIACVALVGCSENAQLEPEPSPEGAVEALEPAEGDADLTMEIGADAAAAQHEAAAAKEKE